MKDRLSVKARKDSLDDCERCWVHHYVSPMLYAVSTSDTASAQDAEVGGVEVIEMSTLLELTQHHSRIPCHKHLQLFPPLGGYM